MKVKKLANLACNSLHVSALHHIWPTATPFGEMLAQYVTLAMLLSHPKQRETSIILDAAKYIKELKQKVERLNQDVTTGETSRHSHDPWPEVVVESLETGFLVNIFSKKSCPGLLVSILEVFDELGLHVMEARVSCANSFRLEALGGENDENGEIVDAQAVKQAVSDAIQNWSENNDAN